MLHLLHITMNQTNELKFLSIINLVLYELLFVGDDCGSSVDICAYGGIYRMEGDGGGKGELGHMLVSVFTKNCNS